MFHGRLFVAITVFVFAASILIDRHVMFYAETETAEHADCGDDGLDYPGDWTFRTILIPGKSAHFLLEHCYPRRAWAPRDSKYLTISIMRKKR